MLIGNIKEWDIQNCDANIFRKLNVISEDTYKNLLSLPKIERNIFCGKLQREDKSLYHLLNNEIKEVVDDFIYTNNLENFIIDRVKDAVWVINKLPHTTLFYDSIQFVNKRSATSLINMRNKSFFYNSITGELFTRGFGNISCDEFHILRIVKKFMALKENKLNKEAYNFIHSFIWKYNSGEVEAEYYKQVLDESGYNMKILSHLITEL